MTSPKEHEKYVKAFMKQNSSCPKRDFLGDRFQLIVDNVFDSRVIKINYKCHENNPIERYSIKHAK